MLQMQSITSWCRSTSSETLNLGRDSSSSSRSAYSSSSSARSKKLRWKELLMKLKQRKRKMFESSSLIIHEPYNLVTYQMNFDQGFVWEETDNVSRSFSVKFCRSSSISATFD